MGLNDARQDDRRIILWSKHFCETMRKAFRQRRKVVEVPSEKGSARIDSTADRWAIRAVQGPKLHNDVRQVAVDGDRHHRLEGRSGSQDRNVSDEDATTIRHPPARSAMPVGWNDGAGSSHGRRNAGGVADLAIAILEGDGDLLPDAILARCVKIGVGSSTKVLTLGVLLVTFLTVQFHAINITPGIFAYTRVILIGANNNMLSISELSPWVGTTAAVARERTPAPTVAAWSGS